MFFGAILCAITLGIANFGTASFFHATPDYMMASKETFDQFCAIMIYYFVYVRPEVINGNVR